MEAPLDDRCNGSREGQAPSSTVTIGSGGPCEPGESREGRSLHEQVLGRDRYPDECGRGWGGERCGVGGERWGVGVWRLCLVGGGWWAYGRVCWWCSVEWVGFGFCVVCLDFA